MFCVSKAFASSFTRSIFAISSSKNSGLYSSPTIFLTQYERVQNGSIRVAPLCRELGISKQTYYNYVKMYVSDINVPELIKNRKGANN